MRRSKIQSLPASRSRGLRALRDDEVKELGNLRGTHFKLMLGNPRIGVKSVGQEIYGLRRVFVLKFQAGEIAQLYPLARVQPRVLQIRRAVISVFGDRSWHRRRRRR